MTVALIDADVVAHRAAAVGTDQVDWGDGGEGPTLNTRLAIHTARHLIAQWTRPLHTRRIILCFSDPDGVNFRKALFPDYKANRGPGKPGHWLPIIEAMKADHDVAILPGLEADDVMGIYATGGKLVDPVIVSIDKDMATLPVKWFNPDKMKKPALISQRMADRAWMKQTLCGDTVDNFKGLPGCGPVTADKLLPDGMSLREMWIAVETEFLSKGHTREDAITQARMARILRRDDFNKATGDIRAWHPTKDEWLSLKEIKAAMPSTDPTTTPGSPSSPSSLRSGTALTTAKGRSSSTSVVTRTKGRRSKTSKRQGDFSTG